MMHCYAKLSCSREALFVIRNQRFLAFFLGLVDLLCVTLIGLPICTLNVRGEQGAQNVEKRVDSILSQMTFREKLHYIGGTGFYDIKPIPRLALPEIFMANGPLGVNPSFAVSNS